MDRLDLLWSWLKEAKHTVFFGGAGVSTDSGLVDFRSAKNGLYHQKLAFGFPPEKILSHAFYEEHPEVFYEFYRTKLLNLAAPPNIAHYVLARLEQAGMLAAVITQNGDCLHQRAGHKRVLDIHGNVYDNTCLTCGKKHPAERMAYSEGIPRCECGGMIRPGILLFDEVPDMRVVMESVRELNACDLLMIGGTSLKVSSAVRLLKNLKNKKIVIINNEPTALDDKADLILRSQIGDVFRNIGERLELEAVQ